MITVREISPDDAAAYWQLRQQIDRETEFLRFEPDDWLVTTHRVRGRIELMLATDNQTIFVAEKAQQLIGFLWAGGGLYRHNHCRVHILLGVLQAYQRQGLGTRLLKACECWGYTHHIQRLELAVMTHNFVALALYQKMGFHIEGTAPYALCIDGKYIDLHYMSKALT
ncbi:MAG TPA: GNAT family N-acetyltransferase [Anaerolineae bacterium]|nr:GNAT family N-acetyltransferase [Anaerolineae bacterium]